MIHRKLDASEYKGNDCVCDIFSSFSVFGLFLSSVLSNTGLKWPESWSAAYINLWNKKYKLETIIPHHYCLYMTGLKP